MFSKNGFQLGKKKRTCERQNRHRSKGRGLGTAMVRGEADGRAQVRAENVCVRDEMLGYRLLQHTACSAAEVWRRQEFPRHPKEGPDLQSASRQGALVLPSKLLAGCEHR